MVAVTKHNHAVGAPKSAASPTKHQRAGGRQKPRVTTTLTHLPAQRAHRTVGGLAAPPSDTLNSVPDVFDQDTQSRWQAWQKSHGTGSIIDYVVWDYLVNKQKLREHQDFAYQYDVLAGTPVSFFFPSANLAWIVDSPTYNPPRGSSAAAKAKLMANGTTSISLHENDLLTNTKRTLDNALHGTGTI